MTRSPSRKPEKDSQQGQGAFRGVAEIPRPLAFRGEKPLGIDAAVLRRMLDNRLRQEAARGG